MRVRENPVYYRDQKQTPCYLNSPIVPKENCTDYKEKRQLFMAAQHDLNNVDWAIQLNPTLYGHFAL